MKNSYKYILSAASFLFLAAGVSFAQDLKAEKSVAPNDKGGYTLTLEAWATGEQVQRTETVAQPLDIVLVLDVSGSMHTNMGSSKITPNEIKYNQHSTSYRYTDISKGNYYYASETGFTKILRMTNSNNNRILTCDNGESYTVSRGDYPWVASVNTTTRTKNRLDALKEACNTFIQNIAKNSTPEATHRISIVKFAGESSDAVGNGFYYEDSGTTFHAKAKNYTQVMSPLSDEFTSLTQMVNSLQYGGTTGSDYGMSHAYDIIDAIDRDSHKIVVMFTDGEPNHYSGFDNTVANEAISYSKLLKDKDVQIYTVGVFDSETTSISNYMNYVSSNYPSATGMNAGGSRKDSKYYMTASNPAELENVFSTISTKIADDAKTTELTSETSSIRDYVTPQFNLDGDPSDVRIFTVNANSKDSFDESSKSDNLNGQPNGKPGETFAVAFQDGEKAGEKKVVVTGFDFKSHWVGEVKDETSGQNSYNKDGQKIVIEIDIVLAGDASGVIETNTSDSGIYAYDSTTGENIQEAEFTKVGIGFPVPQAVNPGPAYLKIVNNFLENVGPQSAVFEIKDEEGNVLYNVMLTDSNNQATVKVDWLDLEEGETVDSENLGDKMKSFTVNEKGWSMNGISSADSPVNTLYKWDAVDKKWVENVFIFNSGAESEVEHAETYVLDVN